MYSCCIPCVFSDTLEYTKNTTRYKQNTSVTVYSTGYTRNTVGIQRNTTEYKCILFIRRNTHNSTQNTPQGYVEYVASGRILVLGMPDYLPCSPSSMSLASSSSLESGSATGARCRAGGGAVTFPAFKAAVFMRRSADVPGRNAHCTSC